LIVLHNSKKPQKADIETYRLFYVQNWYISPINLIVFQSNKAFHLCYQFIQCLNYPQFLRTNLGINSASCTPWLTTIQALCRYTTAPLFLIMGT